MSIEHYVLLLLFLSQLVLNSAQESKQGRNCISQFICGRLSEIRFPFSDIDNPKCGLSFMNCSGTEPRVQFHDKGQWYSVNKFNHNDRTIVIQYQDFQNDFESNPCESLTNFTKNVSPFLSLDVIEIRPLFKCNAELYHVSRSEFFKVFSNHSGCENYNLSFYDDDDYIPFPPKNQSGSCPVVPRGKHTPTKLWNVEFTINWDVDFDCRKCYRKGGQCLTKQNGRLRCDKGPNKMKKVAIGVVVGIGGVLATALVFCCKRFLKGNSILFWKRKKKAHRVMEEFLRNYGSLAPTRYNFSDIKKITHSFKDKIGQGGYGDVYKGKLLDGRLVAVKLLNKAKGDGEEFVNEVASISRTSHVNIVSLVGFCFDGSKRALIYEFMVNGSLEKFIYGTNTLVAASQLGWEKLYEIAIGVARGLEYLHRGCNTRILHFDIKPHNILLDKDFTPKISDFGLAKLCSREESIISMLGARGTIGYIAPEVISRNFGVVSHKSDVYSYGMMVLEIVGKRKNIDVGVDHTSEIYFPHWIYKRLELNQDLGLPGIISKAEEDITKKLILVALWCIQTNPVDRPTMTRVVEMLEARHETLQIPPKSYLCSPPRSHVQSPNRIRASRQTFLIGPGSKESGNDVVV